MNYYNRTIFFNGFDGKKASLSFMNQNANGMSEIFCFLGFEFEWYFGKGCKGLPVSGLFIDPEVYKYYTKYSGFQISLNVYTNPKFSSMWEER